MARSNPDGQSELFTRRNGSTRSDRRDRKARCPRCGAPSTYAHQEKTRSERLVDAFAFIWTDGQT